MGFNEINRVNQIMDSLDKCIRQAERITGNDIISDYPIDTNTVFILQNQIWIMKAIKEIYESQNLKNNDSL